jgi:hypothetical protein
MRTNREHVEVLMSRTEQVIERAMAAVAASRALREAEAQRRRETFQKIQIANQRRPNIPKGIQLPLDLH